MKDDDYIFTAEEFFDRLDRWMRNAQIVCLVLTLAAFAFLVYVFLTGGAA
jgi:hypothetical protein